jgi:hypothetical protein
MKKIILLLTILVQVSVVFSQTHFVKGFVGAGDNQMNIVIPNADIGGIKLEADDEIAVFDGNLCCGVVLLVDSDTTAILAAADDGSTNGFIPGNKMYFRFWDNSAGKEYHNIVAIVTDNSGAPITNAFSSNGTAFVSISTSNTTKIFSENDGNSWQNDANWDTESVPEPNDDVVISSGSAPSVGTSFAYCGSLTFEDGATLNINSLSTNTGSLIVTSDITGSGIVKAKRYMAANGWHMVSSPVSGQTAGAFLSVSPNSTGVATKAPSRGMMDYNESTDNWNTYFTNTTPDAISAGKGYSIRRESTAGAVEFTGNLINGDVTVPVTKNNKGWNLVGNPFTSAIYMKQEVFGFLTENEAKMDPSYVAAYLWDPTKNNYTIINKDSAQANLASGQGFFIKAASADNVTFTKQMQVHQTNAPFKSATISKPSIVLNAKASDFSSSTKISFNEEMTLGLDPGYDAGLLRSGNGFDIYSRLVADNGVDFAIQALPGKSNDSYVIPIGADAIKGGEIVFSAKASNLPSGYEVMLEDKLTSTVTNIKNGELYLANVAAASKGTGRFFLLVGSALQTGIQDIQQNDIVVYSIGKTVYIKGNVSNNAQFAVYSVDGRLINRFGATSQNLNQLSVAGYTPGIYFVNVKDNNKYKSVKFVVGN